MTEADIMHERGDYWVARERGAYVVYRNGPTHSTSDSAYARTDDGLSIAKARCDYLARARVVTDGARFHFTPAYIAQQGGAIVATD